jgi:hypothetical protein
MTRGFKVLLPAGIRTQRQPEGGARPILSWVSVASPAHSPIDRRPGFPDRSPLRFLRPACGRRNTRRSGALPAERVATTLAGEGHSLEVRHQDPILGFSREPWVRSV